MSEVLSHPELALALARRLREVVRPELGSHAGRVELGDGIGGDVAFSVDEVAESTLAAFVADRAPRFAFYSEDRGLVAPSGNETHVLVVDPTDGTRPAMAGLESACVAVALAPVENGDPKMSDLEVDCVVEIKTGDWFLARRGAACSRRGRFSSARYRHRLDVLGLRLPRPPCARHRGTAGGAQRLIGRPRHLRTRLTGFGMTRLGTGQLDAVIEVGSRMIDDVPGMLEEFGRVGRGAVPNNSPYDLAALWRCLVEAGGVVTDGWGSARRLLTARRRARLPDVVDLRANAELHAKLLTEVDDGIERLRSLTS
jgi:myo-inositol-1(or 4)-monophosphatase